VFREILMMRKSLNMTLILLAALLIGGCSRIQEPWVQDKDLLVQERSRSAEQTQELQHRLLRVQSDR
jgi:hypothetical protein